MADSSTEKDEMPKTTTKDGTTEQDEMTKTTTGGATVQDGTIKRRSARFSRRDVSAALAIMSELDPKRILSSAKWAGGFKEEKEELLVAMHERFSEAASRKVNLEQFRKFLGRIRADKKHR